MEFAPPNLGKKGISKEACVKFEHFPALLNPWFQCQTYGLRAGEISRNDGNHENTENDEDNSDSYKQGIECWISGNHRQTERQDEREEGKDGRPAATGGKGGASQAERGQRRENKLRSRRVAKGRTEQRNMTKTTGIQGANDGFRNTRFSAFSALFCS